MVCVYASYFPQPLSEHEFLSSARLVSAHARNILVTWKLYNSSTKSCQISDGRNSWCSVCAPLWSNETMQQGNVEVESRSLRGVWGFRIRFGGFCDKFSLFSYFAWLSANKFCNDCCSLCRVNARFCGRRRPDRLSQREWQGMRTHTPRTHVIPPTNYWNDAIVCIQTVNIHGAQII